MHQLAPLPLWIGHDGDGRAYRELLEHEIRAVVQLAYEEAPLQPPRELLTFRIPLLDGADNPLVSLRLAMETVQRLIEYQVPTLVCSMGMSRSPAIVAAALAGSGQGTFTACLKRIAEVRPVDVSPGLWSALHQLVDQSAST